MRNKRVSRAGQATPLIVSEREPTLDLIGERAVSRRESPDERPCVVRYDPRSRELSHGHLE